jgi:hypothetical protein
MASTTFSGPVTSQNGFIGAVSGGVATPTTFQAPTSTSTLLGGKANAVNTTGKIVGTTVYNTTTKTFYVAQGTADTSTWIDSADGTTTITPA